eukprot:1258341-Rhodomonas_salina.1
MSSVKTTAPGSNRCPEAVRDFMLDGQRETRSLGPRLSTTSRQNSAVFFVCRVPFHDSRHQILGDDGVDERLTLLVEAGRQVGAVQGLVLEPDERQAHEPVQDSGGGLPERVDRHPEAVTRCAGASATPGLNPRAANAPPSPRRRANAIGEGGTVSPAPGANAVRTSMRRSGGR